MGVQPLVSIIIAVSRTEFFESALRSVLAQTHPAIEILICDNAGDDLAKMVVDLYQSSCPWPIHYLRNDRPQGLSEAFAAAIREAHGEYVKFLYGDAILEPDCVEEMVKAFNVCPSATLVSSHRRWIDAASQELPQTLATRFRFGIPTVLNGPDVVAFLGEYTCNFIGELSSTLCRRTDLITLGSDLFSLGGEQLHEIADLVLYAKLLSTGDLILLPRSLTATRIAPRSITDSGIEVVGADTEHVHHFHRLVREAGWSTASLNSGGVRIRTLESRGGFTPFNLLAQLAAPLPPRLNPQQVHAWQFTRTLNAHQQKQIDAHLVSVGVPSILLVMVDDDNSPEYVQQTLNSLGPMASLASALQVVVISAATSLPEYPFELNASLWAGTEPQMATALNQIAHHHDFEWLLVVNAGVRFTPYGLTACALSLSQAPETLAAYADEMYAEGEGQLSSALRPNFNLDYLLSYPLATACHWLFRRKLLIDLGGFDRDFTDAAQFDLILRLIERHGANQITHVSEPLLICNPPTALHNQHEIDALKRHLTIRGYPDAEVIHTLPRRYHIWYNHSERPRVSIIVPTKDQLNLVRRCVETLLHITKYENYEVIVVDNNSETPETLQWLASIDTMGSARVRVLRYPFPFNYSRINNVAAAQAKGDYLVLLNNDTAIVHGRWLDELLNHALRPEVGIVGTKLLFPTGRIQHAGVRLGMDGPAGHQHLGEPHFIQGYMQRVQVDQNLSALTAACLIIRRSIYNEVGGLDETAFVVSYNDVDLSLKVGKLGYLNVWTPHAVLIHEGSVSQKTVDTAALSVKQKRFLGEQLEMYRRWLPTLAVDSAFNILLSHDIPNVELELNTPLVWPPATWRRDPIVLAYPSATGHSAQSRVLDPFRVLEKNASICGVLSASRLSIVQEARLAPDVIVFQATLDPHQVQDIARVRLLTDTRVVLDLNDLDLGADRDDPFAFCGSKLDILKQCLKGTDRVVASSQLMAEIAGELHANVHWVPSRLPVEYWANLSSLRRQSDRPRVGLISDGWQLHDVEMILPVVQALNKEVEWIVMGDAHGILRGCASEYHQVPSSEHYPQAIASLNLDLGLLPAVDNLYSACKSNLPVLQLGACGVPLICSDVRAYQGELPLTLVPNTLSAWVELIRAHTANLEDAALLGDQLRRQVLNEWTFDNAATNALHHAWVSAS